MRLLRHPECRRVAPRAAKRLKKDPSLPLRVSPAALQLSRLAGSHLEGDRRFAHNTTAQVLETIISPVPLQVLQRTPLLLRPVPRHTGHFLAFVTGNSILLEY